MRGDHKTLIEEENAKTTSDHKHFADKLPHNVDDKDEKTPLHLALQISRM